MTEEDKQKKEFEEALESSKEIFRQLKKVLKLRSKSQLIGIVITYSDQLTEMQGMLKQLHEENKELKDQLQETKNA